MKKRHTRWCFLCLAAASFVGGCNVKRESGEPRESQGEIAAQGSDADDKLHATDEEIQIPIVDWSLLWFDEERRLTHMKVIFLAPGGGELTPPKPPLATIDCDGSRILRRVEIALRDESLIVAPSSPWIGASGGLPNVEIQLTTSNGKDFKIWIDRFFLLDNPVASSNRKFFNWTFATILDELRAQHLGDRLKFEHFDRMSGEWSLQDQKDKWLPLPPKD